MFLAEDPGEMHVYDREQNNSYHWRGRGQPGITGTSTGSGEYDPYWSISCTSAELIRRLRGVGWWYQSAWPQWGLWT